MTLGSRTTTVLAILLVASLATNFFVAGMAFSNSKERPGRLRMMAGGHEEVVQMRGTPGRLSEEGRAVLRDSLRGRGESIRQHAEAMSQAQEAIREALRATPFDTQALAAAQEQMRDAVDAVQRAMQENMLRVASQLSDEDRAALAEMPVQSPLVVFRRQMHSRDHGPDRPFVPAKLLPGASSPPAPGEGR